MLTHEQLRSKALSNQKVLQAFNAQGDEFALLDVFLKARHAQGFTQAQVAAQMGTSQSAVARMESGRGAHSPSLATLTKYAKALGYKLEWRLVQDAGE
jgi:transcriptional regulator with XRE-family HTH domain